MCLLGPQPPWLKAVYFIITLASFFVGLRALSQDEQYIVCLLLMYLPMCGDHWSVHLCKAKIGLCCSELNDYARCDNNNCPLSEVAALKLDKHKCMFSVVAIMQKQQSS